MSRLPKLTIRADAGGRHGAGHVMRMLALGQAYQGLGGEVTFLCASCPEPLAARLRDEGIEVQMLTTEETGGERDHGETLRLLKELGGRWLVLDGYHFGLEYQRAMQETGTKVLCVDDFGYCDRWACDAYLNQNLDAEKAPAPDTEAAGVRLMRGAVFALLRREFLQSQPSPKPWGPVRRILVTMGGVDPDNATLAVLELLDQITDEEFEIRALLGPGNLHVEQVRAFQSRHALNCVAATSDMVGEYRWADAVISAGGSSCWEWLYLGLPGAVVTIADNQVPVVKSLRRGRVAHTLGWPSEFQDKESLAGLRAWLADPAGLIDEDAARSLVDGRGAERVARYLAHELVLRPALAGDADLYFEWVNDPAVRANALVRKEITWEEHGRWFAGKVTSPEALLLVAERRGESVGQVRFERRERSRWEVGISVAAPARGGGIGSALLWAGIDEFRRRHPAAPELLARVRIENEASRSLFERAGFSLSSTSDDGIESYLLPAGAGGKLS